MKNRTLVIALAVGALSTQCSAQAEKITAVAPPAPPPAAPPADPTAIPAEPRLSLGYLSDPDIDPEGFFDALLGGKISLDNRFRVEYADTTGRDHATAVTNRVRLGYRTKPIAGLSGYVEMENVSAFNSNNYFVPATGDGSPRRTVIADPIGTEINQAYGRYETENLFGSDISLEITGGRQRVTFDGNRFVGNVGWRQFEQTLDAVSVRSNLGVDKLALGYVYFWQVNRIFGPDGPQPDADSHLINLSYRFSPKIKLTSFAYLLDFEGDDPLNSSDSFGVRIEGKLYPSDDAESDVFFNYGFTYAHQSDAGDNPVDYDADFIGAELKVTKKGLGSLTGGYQFLGSDDGNFAFRFPLGTNHKFQGFADNFLVTPADGLQDLYFTAGFELPYAIKSAVTYHTFWSDEGGDNLGDEIDLVLSKKVNKHWSMLVKAAFFDGDDGQPDTTRFWFQTTFRF